MTAGRYAERTEVPVDQTVAELRRLLTTRAAERVIHDENTAAGVTTLVFVRGGRAYRLDVPTPDPADSRLTHTPTGKPRAPDAVRNAIDAEGRRRARALLLLDGEGWSEVANEPTVEFWLKMLALHERLRAIAAGQPELPLDSSR